MKRSIFERVFPPSSQPLLPQYKQSESLQVRSPRSSISPPRIRLQDFSPADKDDFQKRGSPSRPSSSTSAASESRRAQLQAAPLSASVLHHDDPFLPIERAARSLQNNIQYLLDIQSRALSGRTNGAEADDNVALESSLTPTQSVVTPRSTSGMRTVPIRQPAHKKIGLKGARKGLVRKIHEFAELRTNELQVLDTQIQARASGLERIQDLENKRKACTTEIESIRSEASSSTVSSLRSEATNIMTEIQELEHKLLELRVRHRHLLNQADQLESSLESKVSSFQGTIDMVDREARDFLRRPPVSHALADDDGVPRTGMYALKPERRTLEMAKEQWTSEHAALVQRKTDVDSERIALLEGERVWSEAVRRIDVFEKSLRIHTAHLTQQPTESAQSSMDTVLDEMNKVMETLESDLALAEAQNWNLLICAIGAEVEAFRQGHDMLEQTQQLADVSLSELSQHDRTLPTILPGTPRNGINHRTLSPSGSAGSNQSLNDTLREFSSRPAMSIPNSSSGTNKYESEDDEPPADFLLSH